MARCKNCGKHIKLVSDTCFDPYWTHQPPGAAFQDGEYQYCKLTVATPDNEIEED